MGDALAEPDVDRLCGSTSLRPPGPRPIVLMGLGILC